MTWGLPLEIFYFVILATFVFDYFASFAFAASLIVFLVFFEWLRLDVFFSYLSIAEAKTGVGFTETS